MVQIDIEMPQGCHWCPCCILYQMNETEGYDRYCCFTDDVRNVRDYVNKRYPTCPLKEVKKKSKWRWVLFASDDSDDIIQRYKCSECGNTIMTMKYGLPMFCEECGADMRKEGV